MTSIGIGERSVKICVEAKKVVVEVIEQFETNLFIYFRSCSRLLKPIRLINSLSWVFEDDLLRSSLSGLLNLFKETNCLFLGLYID